MLISDLYPVPFCKKGNLNNKFIDLKNECIILQKIKDRKHKSFGLLTLKLN